MAAHDIVVHRLMQGGEDAIDQQRIDRHRYPVRQMPRQHRPRHQTDTGQHREEPDDAAPGEFARQGLGDGAAPDLERPRGVDADLHLPGEQRAGRAVRADTQDLFVVERQHTGSFARYASLDDTYARGHARLQPTG